MDRWMCTQIPRGLYPCQTMTNYNVGQCIASGLLVRFCPDAIWCCTVMHNLFKKGRKYWATHFSARSFTRTAHLFACFALLASLVRIHCAHSFTCLLTRSRARGAVEYSPDNLLPLDNWLKTNRML